MKMKKYGCPECGHEAAEKPFTGYDIIHFRQDDGIPEIVNEMRHAGTRRKGEEYPPRYKCRGCDHEFDNAKIWITNREEASK